MHFQLQWEFNQLKRVKTQKKKIFVSKSSFYGKNNSGKVTKLGKIIIKS